MYVFFVSATPPSNLVQVAFVLFKFELFALPFRKFKFMARGTRWRVAHDGVWLSMVFGSRWRVAPDGAWLPTARGPRNPF